MSQERVLVTGAGGFIGSHLVDRLVREGDEVRAFVHYNCRNHYGWIEDLEEEVQQALDVFPGDLRDPFAVRKSVRGCRKIYHLGALIAIPYSYIAPMGFVETNVKGTLNMLQAALDEDVELFVHTSTSETYGTAQYVPIDEAHPLQGQSPYSASKIGADKLAESYHLSFGLPLVIVRPFNTYGPRQSGRAVIPTIIGQALAGTEIRLGSLEPVRDLTFVSDIVEGFIRAGRAKNIVGEAINLGCGEGISIGDLVSKIKSLLNLQVPIVQEVQRVRPEKSEVLELVCNGQKAIDLLGWRPKVTLEQGLKETIEWMRCNLHLYRVDVYNR